MAKTTKRRQRPTKSKSILRSTQEFVKALYKSYKTNRIFRLTIGLVLLSKAAFILFAFVSYLIVGQDDQSIIQSLPNRSFIDVNDDIKNWLGLIGASVAYLLIYKGLGISVFVLPFLIFFKAWHLLSGSHLVNLKRFFYFSLFISLWLSLLIGYIALLTKEKSLLFLCGYLGYMLAIFFDHLIKFGTPLLLVVSAFIFILNFYKKIPRLKLKLNNPIKAFKFSKPKTKKSSTAEPVSNSNQTKPNTTTSSNPKIETQAVTEDDFMQGEGFWDPTTTLPNYEFPDYNILINRTQKLTIGQNELKVNKNNIIRKLSQFDIGIQSITVTVGPTITLYEMVPEEGVKVANIESLKNDIALSLGAKGIRMLAPIPGKKVIGIEIPNFNRQVVGLKSLLETEDFQNTNFKIPLVVGKTVQNEIFLADLTEMPHLLIAGATGQGKSVLLNIILISILYKIHPAYVKFVLIDPKKVEFSLFSCLQKHYLAILPSIRDTILTENEHIIAVLESLCVEMEDRSELLKKATTKNIKEYNQKFCERKLNRQQGHRFLPYIVVVIDELADLMIMSGKAVEQPITRLAQRARAVGIHLIISTQRPSAEVITGLIKANFPARIALKVASKVDSRTILDSNGADQLIGEGDLLLSFNSELFRIQAPFIETNEINLICEHVSRQPDFETSYLLPDLEIEAKFRTLNLQDLDQLFGQAARLVVQYQRANAPLIQRELKISRKRASEILKQLETTDIIKTVSENEESLILIRDVQTLERLLKIASVSD